MATPGNDVVCPDAEPTSTGESGAERKRKRSDSESNDSGPCTSNGVVHRPSKKKRKSTYSRQRQYVKLYVAISKELKEEYESDHFCIGMTEEEQKDMENKHDKIERLERRKLKMTNVMHKRGMIDSEGNVLLTRTNYGPIRGLNPGTGNAQLDRGLVKLINDFRPEVVGTAKAIHLPDCDQVKQLIDKINTTANKDQLLIKAMEVMTTAVKKRRNQATLHVIEDHIEETADPADQDSELKEILENQGKEHLQRLKEAEARLHSLIDAEEKEEETEGKGENDNESDKEDDLEIEDDEQISSPKITLPTDLDGLDTNNCIKDTEEEEDDDITFLSSGPEDGSDGESEDGDTEPEQNGDASKHNDDAEVVPEVITVSDSE